MSQIYPSQQQSQIKQENDDIQKIIIIMLLALTKNYSLSYIQCHKNDCFITFVCE